MSNKKESVSDLIERLTPVLDVIQNYSIFDFDRISTDQFEDMVLALKDAITALQQQEGIAEKLKELVSGIRSINRTKGYEVPQSVTNDDEPCYWQRKEWVDWILETAFEADELLAEQHSGEMDENTR